jgi:hypothetical protein
MKLLGEKLKVQTLFMLIGVLQLVGIQSWQGCSKSLIAPR